MLWQSIRRLAKTTIEWEDNDYMGINSLLGARMDKDVRISGRLYFTFDPLLAQHVLAPRAWGFDHHKSGQRQSLVDEGIEAIRKLWHAKLLFDRKTPGG